MLEPDPELVREERLPVGFGGVVGEGEARGFLEGHFDGGHGACRHFEWVVAVDEA